MDFLNSFQFNYKDILVDEIALDGLEGIGLRLLWKRVEKRIDSIVTQKLKIRFWKFLIDNNAIKFYLSPEALQIYEIIDRFMIVDEDMGHLVDPPDYVDGPYEFCLIENEYGSCANYKTRTLLKKSQIRNVSYEEIETQYGERLLMVASIEERWRALANHLPITYLNLLSPTHYCILELTGKARENGQMTLGKTNLTKIVNESKLLFYNRKQLQELDLIKVQYVTQIIGTKSMKTIMLRLKRFHKPILQTLPKVGRIRNMVNYLLEQPDFCERNELMIKKGFMTPQHCKRLRKTFNVFNFEDKSIKYGGSPTSKSTKQKTIIRRFICLNSVSDDEYQSDDEVETPTLKCEYMVGVSLLRQAYERFLDAGLRGLTQIEIAQLLGVEFYTSRSICRIFRARNVVREFLEDKGRQRTARYVAIAATKEVDKKYAEEKKKFFEFYDDNKIVLEQKRKLDAVESNIDNCPEPTKKRKKNKDSEEAIKSAITEITRLEGVSETYGSLINAKKTPTLRQLKFANGMLKVVNERQFVIGFQTLGNLVAKEIGQPTMDTKALKIFIQKLVTDKQLKILRMKLPGFENKYSFLICAVHVKATDPLVKEKYKELCLKSQSKIINLKKKAVESITRPLAKYIYPRYMKIQKLHEHIVKLVYFDENVNNSFPPGFSSMFSIIPEMSVEFALGNISFAEGNEIIDLNLSEDSLNLKLKEARSDITKTIINSKSLQNSIRLSLKILALLGLLQIIEKPSSAFSKDGVASCYVFYVNRHAKILDTAGKWPRSENLKDLVRSFYFGTFDDVIKYWNTVNNISLNTTISVVERERYKLDFSMRNEHNVQEFDNGERYGDGLGPCGFDSSIFMDVPRLWNTFTPRNIKKPVKSTKKTIKIAIKKSQAKKLINKSKKTVVNLHKINNDKIEPPTKRARRKRFKYPKSLKWSTFEDRILTMCKAAMTIMSPISQSGCIKIRNTVAKDLLTLIDPQKGATLCHKRSQYLELNALLNYEKDCIVSELRRHHKLIESYDGLLKLLKMSFFTDATKLINETKLPMLELVWLMLKMERNKKFLQPLSCVAKDIDDFKKRFNISPSLSNNEINSYKTLPSNEIDYGAVKEGIVMAVMLSFEDKISTDTAKKIYAMFKAYPEIVLKNAIDQLRKGGAIVPREKILNNQMNTPSFDNIVQSSYKISSFYRRKWLHRFQGDFYPELSTMLFTELPTYGLKGRAQLNCLLCELTGCNVMDIISDTVPIVTGCAASIMQEEQMNVIDIETKYKLKSGLIGWKNKKNLKLLSEVFEKLDYEHFFKSLSRDSFVNFKTVESRTFDMKNEILSQIEVTGFKGSTFNELKALLLMDDKTLLEELMNLESEGFIKRIGYFQNRILLTKFTKPLLLHLNTDKYMLPTPWLDMNLEIRKDILLKWSDVVINKVFEYPGCSLLYLINHFECISARGVQDICMFLEKCKCVIMKTMKKNDFNLFSDDDDVVELEDFNPYAAIEDIYVFPVKNCLTRYAYTKKVMNDC